MTDDAAVADAGGTCAGGVPARWYWAVLGLVWLALVLPVLLVGFPPLHDYPNHLARVYVLGHLGQSPALQEHYSSAWLPYPNLAVDVLVTPLARVMDAQLAGRLFLLLLPTWFLFGADRLARALHGQASWSVPLVGFFFFNTLYFYGFLNYVFGVGLYLLAFACWLQDRRAPSARRLLLAVAAALAAYLAHKTAFAFLAVSVLVTLVLDRPRWSWRGLLRGAAVLLPGVALDLVSPVPPVDLAMAWDSATGKLKGLASLISIYRPTWDVASALALLLALVLVVRAGGRVNRVALGVAAGFAGLFLVFPSEVGGTWAADRRFVLPAATLALLSLCPSLRGRTARVAYAGAVGLVLFRAGQVLAQWPALSDDIERRVSLLQAVPRGARLFGFALLDKRDKTTWTRQMGLVYLHHYAVMQRGAFVNGLFAHVNQQPLRERAQVSPAQLPGFEVPPAQVDWDVIFAQHDHVFASQLTAPYRQFLAEHCQVVDDRIDVALYRRCRK